jgi:AcrR family transcriptional regulator
MDQGYATIAKGASGGAAETAGRVNNPPERDETRAAEPARPAPAPSAQPQPQLQPQPPTPAPAPTPPPAQTPPPTQSKARCTVAAIAEKARPLRRDAERNRLLILTAARTVFAQRGLEASLDEIAKEAGLGVGTVYRRFPNREALVDALLTDMIAGIERILNEALAMPRAWDGLTHFMRSLLESQAEDKALRDVLLARKIHEQMEEDLFHEQIQGALNDLVARAQKEGDLRPDATTTDIGVLEIAAVGIVELTASAGPEIWRRYLSIILDGLRARPTGTIPLEQPALDEHQMDICMTGWKYGSREAPRTRPKSG